VDNIKAALAPVNNIYEDKPPSMPDEPEINWDIELNFDLPREKKAAEEPIAALPPKIPPRELLKEKFPRILNKINLLWGTIELHNYFQQTQFMDRESRAGFPPDVVDALGQLNAEHEQLLLRSGILSADVWDLQFRDIKNKK
jgi:hypothetical protein